MCGKETKCGSIICSEECTEIYNRTIGRIRDESMEINIRGYEVREYIVSRGGNQGHISLPSKWIGHRVKVVLLEPAKGGDA